MRTQRRATTLRSLDSAVYKIGGKQGESYGQPALTLRLSLTAQWSPRILRNAGYFPQYRRWYVILVPRSPSPLSMGLSVCRKYTSGMRAIPLTTQCSNISTMTVPQSQFRSRMLCMPCIAAADSLKERSNALSSNLSVLLSLFYRFRVRFASRVWDVTHTIY